jgi:hypothetical protein
LESVAKQAEDGNLNAAKMIMDRFAPIPKGRIVAGIKMPVGLGVDGVLAAFDEITLAVNDGLISAAEANDYAALLRTQLEMLETRDVIRRIDALEQEAPMKGDIIKRLQALEQRRTTRYVPPPAPSLVLYIIAYFGGHFDAKRSPRENYELAIAGHVKADGDDPDIWPANAFKRFRKLSPAEVAERHVKVLARILKRRGIDLVTWQPWDKVEKLLKALHKSGIVPADSWLPAKV